MKKLLFILCCSCLISGAIHAQTIDLASGITGGDEKSATDKKLSKKLKLNKMKNKLPMIEEFFHF